MEWIKCEDSLPPLGARVLTYRMGEAGGFFHDYQLKRIYKKTVSGESTWDGIIPPTHWMPLPAPPCELPPQPEPYYCPICQEFDHAKGAKFCKTCGMKIEHGD